MYSVVLLAALTTGAETPSFGWRHGCHGWGGGCHGGYGWGGCCGGCYGGCRGCNGCYGGGCYGGWGCYGGCRGYGWYGCYGCYGGYWGCNGCNGYVGSPYNVRPATRPGGYAEPIPAPAGEKKSKEPKKDSQPKESTDDQAKLIIELPAEAKLFIDNKLMQSTSSRRVFATPTLEPGRKYYYELRAEVIRDGQPLSDTKRVIFQAGDEIRESFAKLGATAAKDKVVTKSEE